MFKNLSPGAVGVSADLDASLELVKNSSYEGLDLPLAAIVADPDKHPLDEVKQKFADAGVRMGGWAMPVEFRKDDAAFRDSLAKLEPMARAAAELGCTRCMTWVPPSSEEFDFAENYQRHQVRFRAICEVLKDYGCRFGAEFIGPKTLRAGKKYEFIHTMEGMLQLAEDVGTGNMGLLLDCWHWYTSHATVDDLNRLTNEQVVYVHVNDAPAGIPIDEQIDNVRDLPGATGVIDIAGFLQALHRIGYDGPVTPEPFRGDLRDLPNEECIRLTAESMDNIWQTAGLG